MGQSRIGSRRLTLLYLLFAGTAVILVLVAAWWSGRGTPAFETRRLAYIQLRMLRQARDRLLNQLNEIEFKARTLAATLPAASAEKDTEVAAILERTLGLVDLEGLQLRRFSAAGDLVLDLPPGGQRVPRSTPEEIDPLLAWNREAQTAGEVKFDLLPLPFRSDIQSRDVVRYSVSIWQKDAGGGKADGVLCLWFPSTLLLSSYLIPTHLLPESYSFALYWDHGDSDTAILPTVLWHSAEPQWVRSAGQDANNFLKTMISQTRTLRESGEDYGVFDIPRRDGHERKEVIALVPVVFGAKRWIVGLSTPYDVAVESSAAQRSLLLLLTLLSLAILLVGVGLLYYQRSQLADEATEQRQRQLTRMQSDYRELFSENPAAMLVFDDNQVLVDCNFSAERLVGRSREEAVGQAWTDLFKASSAQPLWEALRDKGHLYARDAQLMREEDNAPVLVEVWGRRIGEHWIVMAQNVEQRRDFEQQLSRLKRMDSIGALASTLAHDFNNLLGQMQIMVSNLRTEITEGSPLIEDLGAIEKKIDDASEMVANLLAARENVVSTEPIRIEEALTEFSAHLKHVLPRNVEPRLELRGELPPVWITPHALRRVLDNLCLNAADAMPNGGTLTIKGSTRRVDQANETEQLPAGIYAVIEVADTGVGMSREVLDTIFEPFFTTKLKGKGRGMGLGLWTVYRVIRRVGGWVHVQSRPGSGTRFTVYLPRDRHPIEESSPRAAGPGANGGDSRPAAASPLTEPIG